MKDFIFKMLLARLKWPDMLVREQTFHAIKDFLIRNQSFKYNFLTFLEAQNLESKVLEILAIIYLVNHEQTNYFTLNEVETNIKAPSLLSDIFLEEIFQLKLERLNRSWRENHSASVPYCFKKDSIKMQTNGLVSNNLDFLKKICKFEFNFEEQFYFEYKQVMSKQKCLFEGKIDYFCESRYAGFPNIKLIQDDIQISAFLRLISYCVDVYNMPIDIALIISQDFLPIDLGLLELKPSTKPFFINNLINSNFQQWNFQENDFIPVYLSCPLKEDTDAYFNKEIIALEIYPVHLNHIPKSLENYFDFFRRGELWKKIKKIPWHTNIKKIIIPENIPKHYIGLFHNCYNYIQRLYTVERDLFIPNEKDLKLDIEKDKLLFKIDECIIGYMQYWYDNYNIFSYKDTTCCAGIITYLHKDYIGKINVNNDVTLLVNCRKFKTNNQDFFELSENLYYSIKI